MENRCHKCGAPAASDQAFCAKCGAVLGMADDARGGASPDLAATMVGAKLPPSAAPRPAPRPPAPPHRPSAAQPQGPTAPPQTAPARGGNTLMIVLAVGLVGVLLVGTLLLLFFLLGRG